MNEGGLLTELYVFVYRLFVAKLSFIQLVDMKIVCKRYTRNQN